MWGKIDTSIEGLYILNPFFSEDNRGNFVKIFEKDVYDSIQLPNETNEIFVTRSKPFVVRGMHFQYRNPQAKFVSVMKGRIFDVAIDLRTNSATFGKWYSVELSEDNHKIFAIPAGFAHGFQVVSDEDALVVYQCIGKYDKESDAGIRWNDKEIGIDWPVKERCIVSERDSEQMTFRIFKETIKGL